MRCVRLAVVLSAVAGCLGEAAAWGDLIGCGPDTGTTEGPSKAIPNDPDNLKGWFHREQVDDAGNKIEVWCIEIQGGVGNSFGYRYIPKNGTPVWHAQCAFVGGVNTPSKESTGDANKNGRPDGWKTLNHTTEDDGGGGAQDPDDDDKQPGKKDYTWEYDVANNVLKRWETLNGAKVRQDPDFNGPAPTRFSGLFAAAPPGNDGQRDMMFDESKLSVHLLSHVGANWLFELEGNDLTEFSPTLAMAGDSWSMAVNGVVNAIAPPGWAVDFTSDYVTWTYTGVTPWNVSANPVSGFGLVSDAPANTVYWLAESFDDVLHNFGYDGTAVGPFVPEPVTIGWVGMGLLACRRRLRRA